VWQGSSPFLPRGRCTQYRTLLGRIAEAGVRRLYAPSQTPELLPDFLVPFPKLIQHTHPWKGRVPAVNRQGWIKNLSIDRSVPEVDWLRPGEEAAHQALREFIRGRLPVYSEARNDPNRRGQSDLSPYLHFGQLSAQRVALDVLRSPAPEKAKEAFLEELITRRELSDNFCFYRPDYDSAGAFPDWAKKTLAEHRRDKREYVYTEKELQEARTHDDLWNAAQLEMVLRVRCTAICACTGPRRSSNGLNLLKRRWK